jgi:APA family basic amino acid/polyamine antiporter
MSLFPTPTEPTGKPATRDLPRTIGFFGAVGIMIGVTIGSGIFRTPHDIANEISSPLVILLMWVAGGVLSLLGALTYTEMAVMFPRSGGLYNFLHQGFGQTVSFIFGWTYMLITKPFAAAGIAAIFANYLHLNEHVGQWLIDHRGLPPEFKTQWPEPIAVCVMLVSLTGLNAMGMRLGAGAGVVLTGIKCLSLAAICLLAVSLPGGAAANFAHVEQARPWLAAVTAVMSSVLWTYDGWSDVGSVAGEVKNPQRTIPRVYLLGTLLLVVIYVAVNAAYHYVLSVPEMQGTERVASVVMTKLVGSAGGAIVTAMVLVSTLGATHAAIITGARVTFAQAQDGLLFRFLGRVHPKYQTPDASLWMQCLLSCVAVLFLRSFDKLADGFVFTMWIFYGLGGLAVIVLRVRRPELARPYKVPGYPVVPLLFVGAAVGMTTMEIVTRPWTMTVPWLIVLAAGWPAFWVWRWIVGRAG